MIYEAIILLVGLGTGWWIGFWSGHYYGQRQGWHKGYRAATGFFLRKTNDEHGREPNLFGRS